MNVLWLKLKCKLLLWDWTCTPLLSPSKHMTYEKDSRLEQHKAPRSVKVYKSTILLELIWCNKMPQKAFRATAKITFSNDETNNRRPTNKQVHTTLIFSFRGRLYKRVGGPEFYFFPWWLTACGVQAKHVKATSWSTIHRSVSAGHWLVLDICQCL